MKIDTEPPPPAKNYVFGYGSLMDLETRIRLAPSAQPIIPVVLSGFIRGWFTHIKTAQSMATYLGIIPYDQHTKDVNIPPPPTVNGIIYGLTAEELLATDEFEKNGYKRVLIKRQALKCPVPPYKIPDGNIWLYQTDLKKKQPKSAFTHNTDYSVLPSYLQTCLRGCRQLEELYPQLPLFTEQYKSELKEAKIQLLNNH
jgi:hypothetical protein